MLKLLPCLSGLESGLDPSETGTKPDPETSLCALALQFHLAEIIKSLLRIEKNQQVLNALELTLAQHQCFSSRIALNLFNLCP